MLLTPTWILLLVKPIMSSYFLLWMDGIANVSIQENIPANPFRMLFCIFSFFPIVIVITFYQQLKEKQEEEFVKRSVEKQVDDMRRHALHIEELYDRVRGMRHDIGNHLMVIQGLAENGNTEGLKEYIHEFQERIVDLQPAIKSGNAITDLILSETSERCAKEKLKFDRKSPKGICILY